MINAKRLRADAELPSKIYPEDAGFDLRSSENLVVTPGRMAVVHTDVAVEIPKGYVGLVCSRSGLAAKQQVFVLNSPGIIDSNYRGKIMILLMNLGSDYFRINKGDRVGQLVIVPVHAASEMKEVTEFNKTDRGENGFGSTGV